MAFYETIVSPSEPTDTNGVRNGLGGAAPGLSGLKWKCHGLLAVHVDQRGLKHALDCVERHRDYDRYVPVRWRG